MLHTLSERLLFRGIRKDDAENLTRWRSRKDVYHYSSNPKPISVSEHILWFEQYSTRLNEIRVIVIEQKTGKDIGMVGGLLESDVFEISYYIGEPEYRGKGFAGEAILA